MNSGDFEAEEYYRKYFEATTKEVVYNNRVHRWLYTPNNRLIPRSTENLIRGLTLGKTPLSNFIKRRELSQKCNLCSMSAGLLLLGIAIPKVYVYRYLNGNVKIGFNPNICPPPPPLQIGARSSTGLTRYAKQQLRDAVAYHMTIKQNLSFITLSYSDQALPDHKTAKRQLSNFFKRCLYVDPDFVYCWVAEIQPKRLKEKGVSAIHFHITTPSYFHADQVRKWWRKITNCDLARPHVKKVNKPAHYMAKYMSKNSHLHEGEDLIHWIGGNRFGLCHKTNSALKPLEITMREGSYFDFLQISQNNADLYNHVHSTDYSTILRPPKKVTIQQILNEPQNTESKA